MTDRLISLNAAIEDTPCRNCDGMGWVCENHQDRPWGGITDHLESCECGAGAPCPVCNREMSCAPLVYAAIEALPEPPK